ncbi:MAG: hypothetical protein JXJ04_26175 [Spirochaetales bacterium]|nr:hypothetical protein [Spirochaetales bacterium]
MKKNLCMLLLLVLTPFLFSQSKIYTPDTVLEIIDDLKDSFPRYEGSQEEKQVLAYIEKKITGKQLSYTKTNFNTSDSYHSFSENIKVTLQGVKQDAIIFLIPINHPPDATKETDGIINVALGLSLINHYSQKKPPVTLQFVFLGAEFGKEPLYPLGTSLFLEDFFPEHPVMLLYLSFKNFPRRIIVGGAGQGKITPYWYTIRCSEALKEANVPFLLSGNKNQIFRLGLAQEKTPIEPFLKAGFPAISLSGSSSEFSTNEKKDWIFSFGSFIDILIDKSKNEIPEYWDQHYLFFQVYDFYLIIKENMLLIIFIIVVGIAILFALIYQMQIRSNMRLLAKYFWVIPLIFIVTLILLIISTFAIQLILQLRKDFTLWEAYPFLFLMIKLSIAFLLFVFCLKLIHFIPIPMTRTFYSSLTIALLILDTFLISLINISFVYYYLWAFFFILLAFLFKNRIIRLILILPSPYWIIKLILDFFIFIPEPVFCHTVLFSQIKGNIVISLLILPFICVIVNIFLFFFPARHKRSRVRYNVIALSLFVVNALLIIWTFFIPHFSENRFQNVTARNIIDYERLTHFIEIESSSPLGEISIMDEESVFTFNTTSRKYIIPKKNIPDLLSIKTTQIPFLNRNNVTINIQSIGTPYKVYFQVRADKDFTLYDSNFPFKKTQKGMGYEIQIGIYPPSPLEVQLTLTKDIIYVFSLQIDYENLPFEFNVLGKNKNITTLLTLKKKITLKEN